MKTISCLCGLTFALLLPISATAQMGSTTDVAGWYRTDDGRMILVSPGPVTGFRRLDFDHAEFGSLAVDSDGDLDREEAFRPVANEQGRVLELTAPDGRTWTRVSEAPYELTEVSFVGGGGVELDGLLLRPDTPRIGAVLIHGSGDSDRDNVWAYTFAHALAEGGVCVLFPDKRGSGASGGDWRSVGFDALARDAVAGAREVIRRCGLNLTRVGWLGLSQGGWIAPLAHRFAGGGAFVASVSAAAVPVFDQMAHETLNTLRQADLGAATVDEARPLLEAVRDFATGHIGWERYVAVRRSFENGPLASLASAMPTDSTDWRWRWWYRTGGFDPVQSWAQSRAPVLVVYGERDERDNVPVRESVARLEGMAAAPDAPPVTVEVLPHLSHTLVDEASGWVDTRALSRIVAWVWKAVPDGE